MSITFPEGLLLGIPEIDEQHREIFRRMSELLDLSLGRPSADAVESFIRFLLEYVGSHFVLEEKFMDTVKYPEKAAHLVEHGEFSAKVMAVRDEFRSTRNPMLYRRLTNITGELLREHINKTDRALATYLREHETPIHA